jgi:hypothetical protein
LAQNLTKRIEQGYGVRLELDGLPTATVDLEMHPEDGLSSPSGDPKQHTEGVRPGVALGTSVGGRQFVNNHLIFQILVRTSAHAVAVRTAYGRHGVERMKLRQRGHPRSRATDGHLMKAPF